MGQRGRGIDQLCAPGRTVVGEAKVLEEITAQKDLMLDLRVGLPDVRSTPANAP